MSGIFCFGNKKRELRHMTYSPVRLSRPPQDVRWPVEQTCSERQSLHGQCLLDFIQGFFPKIGRFQQFGFGVLHQVTDVSNVLGPKTSCCSCGKPERRGVLHELGIWQTREERRLKFDIIPVLLFNTPPQSFGNREQFTPDQLILYLCHDQSPPSLTRGYGRETFAGCQKTISYYALFLKLCQG